MENKIDLNKQEIELVPISIVNDIGILFTWKNHLFRAIKSSSAKDVQELFDCGLIKELSDNKLFPDSWVSEYMLDGFEFIVEHIKINNVSYPYEWTFSMLKDAAKAVLDVNIISKKYGYETKDCHSFNIVYDGTIPKFVDLGSFISIEPGSKTWKAYEQYLKSYYYPLRIWGIGNSFIARSIITNESEFISHSEYLLFKFSGLRILPIKIITKVTKKYFKYKNISLKSYDDLRKNLPQPFASIVWFLKEKGLLPNISICFDSLKEKLEKVNSKKTNSRWGNYHNEFYDENNVIKTTPRIDRIIEIISKMKVKSVVELGGNQGVVSKLLLNSFNFLERAACTDYDEDAVESMYLSSKKSNLMDLSPVLLNFILPVSISKGKPAYERFKSDIVIALAITHHLLLSQQLRIDVILHEISNYSTRYVMIEFMPLGLWDGNNSATVPHWYTIDWFRSSFQDYFNIVSEEKLECNRVLFVGEKRFEHK